MDADLRLFNLLAQFNKEWLKGEGSALYEAFNMDETWALIRMNPARLLETGIAVQEMQQVPSWGGFNSMLYAERPPACKIGYCPMIEGSSGEFSTIYTVMKRAQKFCFNLGLLDTVITFDLAIYMKAKQIQMKFPDEFSDSHSPWWISHCAQLPFIAWQEVSEFWFGRPPHRVWSIRSWYYVSNNERKVLQ